MWTGTVVAKAAGLFIMQMCQNVNKHAAGSKQTGVGSFKFDIHTFKLDKCCTCKFYIEACTFRELTVNEKMAKWSKGPSQKRKQNRQESRSDFSVNSSLIYLFFTLPWLSPNVSWEWLQAPFNPLRISRIDQWMTLYFHLNLPHVFPNMKSLNISRDQFNRKWSSLDDS